MNVLVTGGLGVNGAFVTRALAGNGHKVIVIDLQEDMSLLGAVAGDIEVHKIDIMDGEAISALLKTRKIDAVVHMAAMIAGVQTHPLKAFSVNAYGAVFLMDLAMKAGVNRFVFTSSRAIYGDISGENAYPNYKPVTEDSPLVAEDVYDVTKLSGELMGRNFAKLGMEFVALRFATIYGPGKLVRHGPTAILSRIIENGLLGLPLHIEKGGDERDDFIYVGDVARACVAAVEYGSPSFNAYNISSGVGHTLGEFAAATKVHAPRTEFSIGAGLNFFDFPVRYAGVLDNSRAKVDLGFETKYDLVNGIGAYIETMEDLGISPVAT